MYWQERPRVDAAVVAAPRCARSNNIYKDRLSIVIRGVVIAQYFSSCSAQTLSGRDICPHSITHRVLIGCDG